MKAFSQIWADAMAAGTAAGEKAKPEAMVVTDGKNTWVIADGVCGFAWVTFAGNTAFGKWAVKNTPARKAWPKGVSFWMGGFGQSMTRKSAFASAFAKVLNENGIEARADSRMD